MPRIFIGSSSGGIKIAEPICAQLEGACEVILWNRIVPPTYGIFGALVQEVERCDLAIFVLTGDDRVIRDDTARLMPRDNVIFELGLFMGGLGRDRVFMVCDRRRDIRFPSDIAYLQKLPLKGSLGKAIPIVCDTIKERMRNLGPRRAADPPPAVWLQDLDAVFEALRQARARWGP